MAFCAMLQRTFDFDKKIQNEPLYVAEATSLPPPVAERKPLPLVRPDRQLTFGGIPHYEWPAPDHDRDTITVDRIRDDIDGPSHRFIICRGDMVEVYFGPTRAEVGEVKGIRHRNREVRVAFREGSDGIWVATGCVYPTTENLPTPTPKKVLLSSVIAEVSCEPPGGFTAADVVPAPTTLYSFDEYKQFRRDFAEGSLSYPDYQSQFARLMKSQDAIVSELKSRFKAPELAVLASRMGSFDAKRSTKGENAATIYRKMLSSFLLDGTVAYSMGERYEDALAKKIRSVTPEEYTASFAERQTACEERQRAVTDPQTFFEFRTFLREKSESDLSDEQLARYDILHADMTRERRASQVATTIERFQSEELSRCEFQIKEGFHDKRLCPLWIVALENRVERSAFDELNRKAKMLGGWYSSFKKVDAGFQFLVREQAETFVGLIGGDADRSEVLQQRKERKEQTAAERLHELAANLAARAEETIERSNGSLQNTARRADIQAGVRGQAYADQALARTLHSIAESLSRGESQYLDGIRHKSHVETLDTVLRLAKWARVRSLKRQENESTFAHGRRRDQAEEIPLSLSDVRFAEYPFPQLYRRHLEEIVLRCQTKNGIKQAAQKMAKRLRREDDDYITFRQEHDIEALESFIARAKSVGANVERIEESLVNYQRLQRAGITDVHELRAALREYLGHRAETRGDDPVKVAERELIGKKLPGFFPTPPTVIRRMLELAEIESQHSVLEPSCGKGDIVDAVRTQHPEAMLHAIEVNYTLSDVLSAKGHEVEFANFLEHQGEYDRIVMNPPFESGADIDHVRHAYSLLKPCGRLVSVMCEGPFFRADSKSIAFRDWIAELEAEVELLPDDAFQGAEVFRETDVRTRLILIKQKGQVDLEG
jgi:hypothetical protein